MSASDLVFTQLFLGQLLWVKMASYPWWPAYVYDKAEANDKVKRQQKPHTFLIKFFGDSTFYWAQNAAKSVQPFRCDRFEAFAQEASIKDALSEALEAEAKMRQEKGADWDKQPDSPEQDEDGEPLYLYEPFSPSAPKPAPKAKKAAPKKAASKTASAAAAASSSGDAGTNADGTKKKKAAAKRTRPEQSGGEGEATAESSAGAAKKQRKPAAVSKAELEKLQQKEAGRRERALRRIEAVRAPVPAEEMLDPDVEKLKSIAAQLISSYKAKNGGALMNLFAELKSYRITTKLLIESQLGKRIKFLASLDPTKPCIPLYDQAIRAIAGDIYKEWLTLVKKTQSTSSETTAL
ncbi:MAG: hypothetical protein Q8P67_10305 [archaeon]|nr:hypothetical protein [archaeon]